MDRWRRCFGQGGVARRRGSDVGHEWRWPAVRPVPTAGVLKARPRDGYVGEAGLEFGGNSLHPPLQPAAVFLHLLFFFPLF
jgi:hypothetical protein